MRLRAFYKSKALDAVFSHLDEAFLDADDPRGNMRVKMRTRHNKYTLAIDNGRKDDVIAAWVKKLQ